jgi:hypothetical protein
LLVLLLLLLLFSDKTQSFKDKTERNYFFMARHEPFHHKLLVFIFQLYTMVV